MTRKTSSETHDRDTGADHRLEISLTGLSFAGEAAPLARRLERLPGVQEALTNPITERAVVRFDPTMTDVGEVFTVLETSGLDSADHLVRRHAAVPGCVCGNCRQRLDARLAEIDGVEAVIFNTDEKSVTLEYVPSRTDADLLTRVLTSDSKACRSAAG